MTSLLTKEEQEELLNQKIEMMKKKNAEIMRRHQLVEEDKRLAEQQGRSVTIRNQQEPYSPMKGEILRAAEEDDKRKSGPNTKNLSAKKYNGPNNKLPKGKVEDDDSGPPPDPACKFLADRRREGPLPSQGRGREFSRRHPRNFGGIDFNDVPKKIHDEKEKQTYQPQIRTKADETLYTTGKERRELQEWRREREKIDRERLERQKNKEGNWRRDWDQNKDELSYTDETVDQDEPLSSRPPQPMPKLVGRIGSGRFALGLHKLSSLHKAFSRKDDRFTVNGRDRHQRKKDGQNEQAAATEHQANNRKTHQSNSKAPQRLNDEATRLSREKPEKLLMAEKSILRRPVDEEKRFRRVQEQNDSLIIKVESQPPNFYRVPSNPAGNYVEPVSPDGASRNHPKNGRRNFHDGRSVSRQSSTSDSSLLGLGKKAVPGMRIGEEETVEFFPTRSYKSDVNADKVSSSRNANKECRGETHDVEPGHCPDESSPRKTQSDSKAEKPVGSGRISIRDKKRRNKNRRKRVDAVSREQQFDNDPDMASGLTTNITQNVKTKIPVDTEYEAKTRHAGAQDRVRANQVKAKPPVSAANEQTQVYSFKNSANKEVEVKNKNSEPAVGKCFEEDVRVKPDLLCKSFDLDQDPPEGDQFDDEEWEDIDEEVCIDLIAGGEEESFEENPLDISDDTLDQLVRAHIIPPRGHKVVDWATEMESAEDAAAVAEKEATAGVVQKSSLASEGL